MKIDSPMPVRSGSIVKGRLSGWPMVFLFLLFYIFSFIDRQIISMMVEPLKRDLALTDFQVSLLLGPAFGIFFILCGLQMGWLVDRFSKRWITALGIATWGLATFSCGLARTFPLLLIGRMGVGVGESTLTPSAHAMIAEQFPKERLSTAIATFSLGAVIGGGLAVAIGGVIVQLVSGVGSVDLPLLGVVRHWQIVFLLVGGITILIAPLALLIREYSGPKGTATASLAPAPVEAGQPRSIVALMKLHPMLFVGLPFGFGLLNVITNAYMSWIPTFMIREFGWGVGQVGLTFGAQHIIAATIGQIGGAMLVDHLYARGMTDAHTRYQIWGVLIAVPISILALVSGNGWVFLVLNGVYFVLCYPFLGYAVSALQIHTPRHLRGQVSAVFLAIVTVVGTGIGAPFTAILTDKFLKNTEQVGLSLVIVSAVFAPLVVIMLTLVSRKLRSLHESGQEPA